jgi:hypothetical protein
MTLASGANSDPSMVSVRFGEPAEASEGLKLLMTCEAAGNTKRKTIATRTNAGMAALIVPYLLLTPARGVRLLV